MNLHTLKIINYQLNLVVINQLRMIRGINYLNTSDSFRIKYSEFFEDYLEIGRLTSEQKSEFTGTRHGVTDSERDNATTGTSRITMTKNKIKY